MRNIYILLAIQFFIIACANIKQPTGGERDEINPTMIKSYPEHNSTNFKGNEIIVYFNEQIESKNLTQELIITPDDEINFKEVPGKKYIKIKLKDTLRSNTTYNFNFGNAIVDITERNPSDNARLAFSTGSNIDTAKITGRVINMFTQKPEDNAVVLLQYNIDTLNPEKHKPTYFAKTDEDGFYSIENLPIDTFQLFAISDNNSNLLYNYGEENISEFNSLVVPSNSDTLEYILYTSSQDTRDFNFISVEHFFNASKIKLNKGLFSYQLNDTLIAKTTDLEKSLLIYHNNQFKDSISTPVMLIDSMNNIIDTIINIKSNPEGDTLGINFGITLSPKADNIQSIPLEIDVNFSLPLLSAKLDSLVLIKDESDTINNFNYSYKTLNNNILQINLDKVRAQQIDLSFANVLIISALNDTISNLDIEYKVIDDTKYGQIQGFIDTQEENVIIELITSSFKVVKRTSTEKDFNFVFIDPGTYKLRAIIDSNNNGKWDPGNHLKNIQPEKVFIDEEEILIKANWIIQDRIFKF